MRVVQRGRKDRRAFKKYLNKTKAANVKVRTFRGGVSL